MVKCKREIDMGKMSMKIAISLKINHMTTNFVLNIIFVLK